MSFGEDFMSRALNGFSALKKREHLWKATSVPDGRRRAGALK
jgi:hypothetical protein